MMKKTKESQEEAVKESLPEKEGSAMTEPKKLRALILKNCVISLRMPSQSSGCVTKSFQEGKIVHDVDSIEQLISADAPIELI